MTRAISLLLAASCALFLLALGQSSLAALKAPGHITVIQAVPGASVDVAIDGKSVSADAGVGAVLGPFDLAAGAHTVMLGGVLAGWAESPGQTVLYEGRCV